MSANRKLVGIALAVAIGACWPLAMRFFGSEVAAPLALRLGHLLLDAGVTDKATFLLVHRLISGAFWILALALAFGLALALAVRGSFFYPWLCFVGAAVISSYIVHVFDGYDPWRLSAEWVYPETWFTVIGIGLFVWLLRVVLPHHFGSQHVAP